MPTSVASIYWYWYWYSEKNAKNDILILISKIFEINILILISIFLKVLVLYWYRKIFFSIYCSNISNILIPENPANIPFFFEKRKFRRLITSVAINRSTSVWRSRVAEFFFFASLIVMGVTPPHVLGCAPPAPYQATPPYAKSNRSPHGERFDFFFKFFRIQICLR